MSDRPPLLVVDGVSKRFGDVAALEAIDLTFARGDVVGLVGGNGAGKTTLLRLLCGLYRPTEGDVRYHDESGAPRPLREMRSRLGVVPEATGLYARLTAWENIRYHTRLHGVEDAVAWARTQRFAEALEISDALHRHTRGFSRGMRQKTALLRALAHGPELLMLDEPTAGLDVTSARRVRQLVGQLRDEGGTVIYSTHHLAEAQLVCDRIVIIHNGQLRADGSPTELMAATETSSLEEAYVALTPDAAREREEAKPEGAVSRWWRQLLTGRAPEEPDGDSTPAGTSEVGMTPLMIEEEA